MTGPWLIHGVVAAGAPRPTDAPAHTRIDAAGLSALVSAAQLGAGETDADVAEALRHHAILSAQAQMGAVVPARFGGAVSGPDAAAAHLAAGAARYARALARIGDGVEFALRLTRDPATARRPEPTLAQDGGHGWLRARAAERTAAASAAAAEAAAAVAALDALRPFVMAQAGGAGRAAAQGPVRVLDAALLVDRGRIAALREAAARLAARVGAQGLSLELLGPWPAYSFAATDEVSP